MKRAVSKANAERYVWRQQWDGWQLLNPPALSGVQERVSDDGASTKVGG